MVFVFWITRISYFIPKTSHTVLFEKFIAGVKIKLNYCINGIIANFPKTMFGMLIRILDCAMSWTTTGFPYTVPESVPIAGIGTVWIPPMFGPTLYLFWFTRFPS